VVLTHRIKYETHHLVAVDREIEAARGLLRYRDGRVRTWISSPKGDTPSVALRMISRLLFALPVWLPSRVSNVCVPM
jgi:hypothetical protein